MDEKLKALLESYDTDGIKEYFFEKEMEHYNSDMADVVISLDRDIPHYDCLVDSIGIVNETLSTELFTDEKAMYCINIHKTDIYNLYFIRTEEFGLDDGYNVVNELKFTDSIEAKQ